MKAYYPVDATGNRIGLKTPEAAIYDASGTNLTTKLNNINSAINSKYSATGGVLNGDLTFPEAGSTDSSSHGINFSGSTDTARIYYKTTSQDQGNLVLQMGDDANSNINFEWTSGNTTATKSYITSDGVYHGKATNASYADSAESAKSVAWNNVSGKPSTYTPSGHSHNISDINNLQNTINSINSNISKKQDIVNINSLYKGDDGYGDITLSEAISNYDLVIIAYGNNGISGSYSLYPKAGLAGHNFNLVTIITIGNDFQIYYKTYQVSSDTASFTVVDKKYYGYISTTGSGYVKSGGDTNISMVIGYKF